jgi:hypothetical protein
VRLLAQGRIVKDGEKNLRSPISRHARGILDLSGAKLIDRPGFLEEKLLKTRGVIAVEINAFSNRMVVEFDPSLIDLDKIKAMIKASNGL